MRLSTSTSSKKTSAGKVSLSSNIGELLKKYPGTVKAMKSLGLDCPSCKGAKKETVLEAARTHGLEPKTLLNELKKAAAHK